jgi:glycosyltransferase involved in cell wall biosynthesis
MICGGVEKSIISLLNEIPTDKYDISLLLVKTQGDFLPFVNKNIKVGTLPLPKDTANELLLGGAKAYIKNSIKNRRFIKGGYAFLKKVIFKDPMAELNISFNKVEALEETYDIAVCYHIHMPFIVRYVAEKVSANKKIAWIHNDFKNSKFNLLLIRKYLNKYDAFFAVSEQLEKEFIEIIPEYKEKTQVFYNIISSKIIKSMSLSGESYKDNFDGIRILTIGRLDRQKGYDMAINVCKNLINSKFNIKWYVIGDGVEKSALKDQISKLGLENHFILLGMKLNPYPYLKDCNIYAQTSRHEGYCTTLEEARCLHKPIVSTKVAGVDEQLKKGITGMIVEFDENEFYDAIVKLLEDEALRNRFSNNLKKVKVDTVSEIDKFLKLVEIER